MFDVLAILKKLKTGTLFEKIVAVVLILIAIFVLILLYMLIKTIVENWSTIVRVTEFIILGGIVLFAIYLIAKNSNVNPQSLRNQGNHVNQVIWGNRPTMTDNQKRNWAREKIHGGRPLRSDETDGFGKIRRPGQHKDPYGNKMKDGTDWVKGRL